MRERAKQLAAKVTTVYGGLAFGWTEALYDALAAERKLAIEEAAEKVGQMASDSYRYNKDNYSGLSAAWNAVRRLLSEEPKP
jgi:hypothetical protein